MSPSDGVLVLFPGKEEQDFWARKAIYSQQTALKYTRMTWWKGRHPGFVYLLFICGNDLYYSFEIYFVSRSTG